MVARFHARTRAYQPGAKEEKAPPKRGPREASGGRPGFWTSCCCAIERKVSPEANRPPPDGVRSSSGPPVQRRLCWVTVEGRKGANGHINGSYEILNDQVNGAAAFALQNLDPDAAPVFLVRADDTRWWLASTASGASEGWAYCADPHADLFEGEPWIVFDGATWASDSSVKLTFVGPAQLRPGGVAPKLRQESRAVSARSESDGVPRAALAKLSSAENEGDMSARSTGSDISQFSARSAGSDAEDLPDVSLEDMEKAFPGRDPSKTRDVVRSFVKRYVRGEKIHVLRADAGLTLCRVGVSRRLDTLKIKATSGFRKIAFPDISRVYAHGDENYPLDGLLTPADDLCVTVETKEGECVTFKFHAVDEKKNFAMCLRLFIEAHALAPAKRRKGRSE